MRPPTRVLDEQGERYLSEARSILGDLRETLAGVPATPDDSTRLATSIRQLDDFFLIVVVGEFNAGKSAFVNAWLGTRVLAEGVTPTTAEIHLIRYGETVTSAADASGVRIVTAPVDALRDLHIVDTPGTNAIIREHERLTADFVPRSDFVFFVTSADRPFTETERAFIAAIREWGKKVVIVVNKVDILASDAEREQVLAFVREGAAGLLGSAPEVFPVSARLAGRARDGETALWAASGFEALETYVRGTLDEASRFRLKLANPLGVGDALARRYDEVAAGRLELLAEDVTAMESVERQLDVYRSDLARGFELRMAEIDKVLLEMEARGHRYFEDTLRVARVFDLLNRARIQREFEDVVIADAPQQIERHVSDLIDWLVDQDYRQWRAVTERLAAGERRHAGDMLGSPDIGSFHRDRARLLESVGREAQRVVETYDKARESQKIADAARTAVAATAAVGASALGLGAAVAVAASTAAADVTGIVMAGVVAALGLLIIPARRRKARAEIAETMSDLAGRLRAALRGEFEAAVTASARRFEDALAPYTRFVRAEETRWAGLRERLAELGERTARLLRAVGHGG